ncbi:MAG: hypothetical protein GWO02_16660, partial [Gammaproteobacteria bacterium]|nr:hypothetical protein [Gammaproteobacteria bacterium]
LRRSRTRHKRKSVSEVWALPGAARRVVAIVVPWAHRRGLAVRVWDESETEVRGT